MARTGKRQNIAVKPMITSAVPPTQFIPSGDSIASLGYASSILNGDTIEGGVKSLTYKSINAVQFVEKLDLMRQAINPSDDFEPLRVSEKDYATAELVEQLKQEVAQLKHASSTRNESTDENIEQLNNLLDEQLRLKTIDPAYGQQVLENYKAAKPGVELDISSSPYSVNKVRPSGIHIDRFEDAKNVDMSAYTARDVDMSV